jgi:hypothetical protein
MSDRDQNQGAGSTHNPAASDAQSGGWQPGEVATDFLGLDSDGQQGLMPNAPNGGQPQAGASYEMDSWLLSIEGNEPVATGSAPLASNANLFDQVSDTSEQGEQGQQAEQDLESFVATEAAKPGSGIKLHGQPTAKSGSKRMLVGALVVLALGAGGWYFAPKFMPQNTPGTDATVATLPVPKPPTVVKQPVSGGTTKTPTSVPATTTETRAPADTSATTLPSSTSSDIEIALPLDPEITIDTTGTSSTPLTTAVLPDTTPAVVTAPVEPLDEVTLSRREARARQSTNLRLRNGARTATDEDYLGMWREPTIPFEAIAGEAKLRTLAVGRVRALLTNGELITGELYAVGQEKIWIDLERGRIALEARDVSDLKQIASSKSTEGTPAAEWAGLTRVEVVVPGGSFIGHLVSQDGDRVTLITEKGSKIVCEALEVRPAPTGVSRLIGRVAKR